MQGHHAPFVYQNNGLAVWRPFSFLSGANLCIKYYKLIISLRDFNEVFQGLSCTFPQLACQILSVNIGSDNNFVNISMWELFLFC